MNETTGAFDEVRTVDWPLTSQTRWPCHVIVFILKKGL